MKRHSQSCYLAAVMVCSALMLGGCKSSKTAEETPPAGQTPASQGVSMDVKKEPFGQLQEGTAVEIYTLANGKGITARLMTYGATLVSLKVPDRSGNAGDIVLGYDALDAYVENSPYFGSIVGRYGNRIAKGKFTLDGTTYTLAANNGENHLHGGFKGYDKVVWKAEEVRRDGEVGVRFSYLSPDGEEGYPGNLTVAVTYMLTDKNELKLEYEAATDKATPVNLTHHSYFNLAVGGDLLGHELMINADAYTPVEAGLIPTGEIRPVEGTPFDFTTPHSIGERIGQVEGGYDHNFVLRGGGGKLELAARVVEPKTGRTMEIRTTEPGIQFYSGNFLDGTIAGKGGAVYQKYAGFCLETQHFPDSPNKPGFPSTILRPGEVYRSLTVHRFSAQ